MIANNNIVSLVLYWCTINSTNIEMLGTVLFIWGLFNSCRTNIGYLYMIELMPKKDQGTICTIWNITEGSIALFATYWFMNVSKHWYGLLSIGIYFQIFTLATVWFLPESPIYLLKRKRYQELKEALEYIALWNGTKLGDWDALGLTQDNDGEKNVCSKAENIL